MRFLVVGDFQGQFPEKMRKRISKEEFDAIIGVGDYTGLAEWRPYIMIALKNSKKGLPWLSAEEYFGKARFKRLLKKDEIAAKMVLSRLDKIGKPGVMVFGNGDDDWYNYKFGKLGKVKKSRRSFVERLKNIKDITYSNSKLFGMQMVGFGGYMDIEAYFDKKQFKDEDREIIRKRLARNKNAELNLIKRLKKIDRKKELMFVLHYPPKGVFDIIKDKKDNPMNGKSAGIRFFREAILKYKPKVVFCGHMHEYQGMKKLGNSLVINPGDAEKGKYAIVDIDEHGKVSSRFVK